MRDVNHAKPLLQPKNRKELIITGNKERYSSDTSLVDLNKICAYLSSLNLVRVSFSQLQMMDFFQSLETNRTLVELTFDDCQLDDVLISGLAKSLTMNKFVSKLNLKMNNCQFEGASSLGWMLKKNKVIKELNLSFNPLGPNGIMEILQSAIHSDSKFIYIACYYQVEKA